MIAAGPKPNTIELLKSLYAMDAKEIKTPWERWQYRLADEGRTTYQWSQATKEINFEQDKLEYRRAPYAPALIVIPKPDFGPMAEITPLRIETVSMDCANCARGDELSAYNNNSANNYMPTKCFDCDATLVNWEPKEDKPAKIERKNGHYFRDVSNLDEIDYYRLVDLYDIREPIAHVFKKCLATGDRGHKDMATDVQDMIDTLHRWQEMQIEDGNAN